MRKASGLVRSAIDKAPGTHEVRIDPGHSFHKCTRGGPFEAGCRGSEVPRPNPKHSRVVFGKWDGNLEPR